VLKSRSSTGYSERSEAQQYADYEQNDESSRQAGDEYDALPRLAQDDVALAGLLAGVDATPLVSMGHGLSPALTGSAFAGLTTERHGGSTA
jgi:hypothetical protein